MGGPDPVRVANNASGQKQLDSISSLIDAISTHLGCGGKLTTKIWNIVDRLAAQLATAPFEPTSGVWEFREPMPIVTALGGVPRFHKANLIPQTADLLAAEHNERGKHVIVIVDEAHLLAPDQLEELRPLTNADMDSHSPFACVLVGQPTLRRRIKLGTFATLDQRIALRSAMPPMTPPETGAYIAHHLNLAGGADTLFSDDATALIHQVARGLPGAVNNLAVQALIAAHATKKAIVDDTSARAAVTEITAELDNRDAHTNTITSTRPDHISTQHVVTILIRRVGQQLRLASRQLGVDARADRLRCVIHR